MNKILIVTALICTVLLLPANSQETDNLETLRDRYEKENAIILNKEKHLYFSVNNDNELEITGTNKVEKLFLSDKAHYYADEYIYHSDFVEVNDIKAFLFTPKRKSYKKMKIKEIYTKDDFGSYVFYDDNKLKKVVFPKVNKNYKSLVTYEEAYHDPHFLGSFYFSSYIPLVEAEFSVSFPDNVKISYKVFNDPDALIKFTKTAKKGLTTYSWQSRNMEDYAINYHDFPISHYRPHVLIFVNEYQAGGKTTKVLSDMDQLYKWYYTYVEDLNQSPGEDLKMLVDSLTRKTDNELQKIKNIYYWVQDHINYVAIEDGYQGFIPQGADLTYRNRYGDCKGMSSILTAMLNLADIPAKLTWVGTRSIKYTPKDLAGPQLHNHMIAAVPYENDFLILDATGEYLPLDMPSSFIQGKEALIGMDKDNYVLYDIPVLPGEKSHFFDTVDIFIDQRHISGSGNACFSGYYRYDIAYELNWNEQSKHKKILKSWLDKGNDKFQLDSFSIQHLKDRDEDLAIDYNFQIRDYVNTFNNTYYINLNLQKELSNEYIDTAVFVYDKKFDYKHISRSHTRLHIPKGYTPEKLPENVSYTNDNFAFNLHYQQTEDIITLEKEIFINTLQLGKAEFNNWNSMIKMIDNAYNQSIALKKITNEE